LARLDRQQADPVDLSQRLRLSREERRKRDGEESDSQLLHGHEWRDATLGGTGRQPDQVIETLRLLSLDRPLVGKDEPLQTIEHQVVAFDIV
jgi:hypothetical protein